MLDTPTKKRIDDCRDILVAKLPDPKAQIEQITIGLIYKFMDDMDKESIELGGKAKFFTHYKSKTRHALSSTIGKIRNHRTSKTFFKILAKANKGRKNLLKDVQFL